MYEELIKRLRAVVDGGREEKCDGCPYEEDYPCCVDCLDTLHKQAADAIEELQNLIDAQLGIIKQYQEYLKKSTWIPVTSALPEEDVAVLTWGKQAVVLIDWHRNGKWFVADGVTHWMPMPSTEGLNET